MIDKKKVTVEASDILKVLDEADRYLVWPLPIWKARNRLLQAVNGVDQEGVD